MSDPNAVTGTHTPGEPEQHLATAGWVPPPGALAHGPRAEPEPTQALPAGSTPGPHAPDRATNPDPTEQMIDTGAVLPRLPPIPGYDVERYIGRGGMGIVYKATHIATSRVVALKLINPNAAHDAVTRERFAREVHALARVKHPNIVAVYDAGDWHGFPYCTMEYVPGGTLHHHFDRI